MAFLIAHSQMILALSLFVVSEALTIVQYLKFPTNQGIGGILVSLILVLKSLGAQNIQNPPSS